MSVLVLDQAHPRSRAHPARMRTSPGAMAPTLVFHLEGELDMANAPRLGRALSAALDERPCRLALDLSGLTFLDSAGGRVLFDTARRARGQGCSLILRSPGPSVLKMLKLSGLDRLLVEGSGPAAG